MSWWGELEAQADPQFRLENWGEVRVLFTRRETQEGTMTVELAWQ